MISWTRIDSQQEKSTIRISMKMGKLIPMSLHCTWCTKLIRQSIPRKKVAMKCNVYAQIQ